MIDFAGYSYPDNRATIVCTHVLEGAPVLVFVHDSDGDIQFLCGESGHDVDHGRVVGLVELLEHVRSMQDIPTVDPSFMAERKEPGTPWNVSPIAE